MLTRAQEFNTKTVNFRWGVLGFRGLRVWPILTLGFRNLHLNRTGFRVLRCDTGCEFGQFLSKGFAYFIQDSYFFRFSNPYSPCRQLRSKKQLSNAYNKAQRVFEENGNVENNRKLLLKIEDFVQKSSFGFWPFCLQIFGFSPILAWVCGL